MSSAAPRSALPRSGVDQPLTHVADAAPGETRDDEAVDDEPVDDGELALPGGVASGAVAARTLSVGPGAGLAEVEAAGAS